MGDFDFSRLSVLVVDDEKFMRTLTTTILTNLGVREIHEAEDGTKALAFLKSFHCHLILMDIDMPVLTGVETLKMLRADKKIYGGETLPVVMLTAHSSMDNIEEAVRVGVHGWLSKPVSADGLRKMVQRALTQGPIDPATLNKGRKQP